MAVRAIGGIEFGLAACAVSIVAILTLARAAPALGLIDVPGGRKTHAKMVPLVGGIAVFLSLLANAYLSGVTSETSYFLFALAVLTMVGVWDDIRETSPLIKFAIQIGACFIMTEGAGIELRSVGDLLGLGPIGLWVFATPLTVFAVVGVVNSMNMLDGMDGLAGCVALIAFAWYGAVAWACHFDAQFMVAVLFCGALTGFLLFNIRLPWQPQARVFLGDAGSLMIGFALAWFAIELTQGRGRSFPPIAALWVVLLPLADCVSLMARRIRRGLSPFAAENRHVHHYLLARGFTATQGLITLGGISALFGAFGYCGWIFGIPESVMFWTFCLAFFAYHSWIQKAWRNIEAREGLRTMPGASQPGGHAEDGEDEALQAP
jgi:UDP-GlcNAc:undecaprenyl-phosphate GlcNAc-1-phosphate transferase